MKSAPAGLAVAALLLFLTAASAADRTLSVGCWNLESGQSEIGTLAERIRTYPTCVVWGFSEVQNQEWVQTISAALGGTYRSRLGTSGGADRLAVVYDSSLVELTGFKELHHLNPGRVRSPMVCQFRQRNNGKRFTVIVNHFARGKPWKRHQLAASLNEWASERPGSTILVGDYNFDWKIKTGEAGAGYSLLTRNGSLRWLRPTELVRTEDSRRQVQDFIFVSPGVQGTSRILVRPDDFEPKKAASDHRPVIAYLTLP